MARASVPLPNATIFVNVARIGVWTIGITWALSIVGVRVSALVAALGIAGLAVSLGLQDTLSNFFAGLQIALSHQVRAGDQIRLSTGEEGTVQDVTWRETTLESASGDLIIVPNALFARALFTNYSKPSADRDVAVRFSVPLGSDLDEVERLAEIAARRVIESGGLCAANSNPVVRFRDFTDAGIGVSVSVRVCEPGAVMRVRDRLVRGLYAELSAAGVEIGSDTAESAPTSAPPPPPPKPMQPPAR
jgi:small-conductance mechanosensitive channel